MARGVHWMSDAEWARIEPLLPRGRKGARRVDDRRVISGIVHMLRSGARWRDCPAVRGPGRTICNRFDRWSRQGIWHGLSEALSGHPGVRGPHGAVSIDAIHVKAHRSAAGGNGGPSRKPWAARGTAGPASCTGWPMPSGAQGFCCLPRAMPMTSPSRGLWWRPPDQRIASSPTGAATPTTCVACSPSAEPRP